MSERVNCEMTEADLAVLLSACRPVPYMVVGGIPPRSPQENANDAWRALGNRMGFDYMTVLPGKGDRFFSAVPKAPYAQCPNCKRWHYPEDSRQHGVSICVELSSNNLGDIGGKR